MTEIMARGRICKSCGGRKNLWADCMECGGEGDVEEPDWEAAMDEPYRVCGTCVGKGGWWLCEKCASPEAKRDAQDFGDD